MKEESKMDDNMLDGWIKEYKRRLNSGRKADIKNAEFNKKELDRLLIEKANRKKSLK